MRSRSLLLPLFTLLLAVACSDESPPGLTAPSLARSAGAGGVSCELSIPEADVGAAIDALIAEVDALEASGTLTAGQANALRSHLENARRQAAAGHTCAALAQLRALREQVENFVADGTLTEAEATPLVGGVDELITFNVALGKPVTLFGTYGVLAAGDPWLATALPPAPGSTLTDGIFLAEENFWHQNSVWWDAFQPASASNHIEIDLGGAFAITRLVAQTDNNDDYPVYYRGQDGLWHAVWMVPAVPGFGMHTRERVLVTAIVATGLFVNGAFGDAYYSASEIQAWGTAVP